MADEAYGAEDAINTISAIIDRKKTEIDSLNDKKARTRKAEKVEELDELISYIRADLASYIAVLADLKDDESLLESIDIEDLDESERPETYDKYMKSLGEEAVELESKASDIREKHCNAVMEVIGQEMGEQALKSDKMIKIMLDDPYMLSVIGETIFYDDTLYDEFSKLFDTELSDKKSKKKGGKKGGKKDKKKSKKKGKK